MERGRFFAISIVFILMLLGLCSAISANGYEPDNNPETANYTLTNGSRQQHNFHTEGDTDYIKFNATAGSQYIIETFNKTNIEFTDTVITLYDSDGTTQMGENDDIDYYNSRNYNDGISTFTSRIVFTAESNATYYVKVSEYSDSKNGVYEISVRQIGRLIPLLVEPDSNANISNGLFNFTISIKCLSGICNNITAILDPEEKNAPAKSSKKIEKSVANALNGNEFAGVIVILKDNEKNQKKSRSQKSISAEEKIISGMKGSIRRKASYSSISGFAAQIDAKGLYALSANPEVEKIFLDRPVTAHLQSSVPVIQANAVWPMQVDGINITGEGETICILDTGINYTHADFGSCSPTDNINAGSCARVIGGYDFINNDRNPMDDNGHGSHVAGIVASSDLIYRGVASSASLVAVKVMNAEGGGSTSGILFGLDWCISNASAFNISVISMSLGVDDSKHNFHCENAAEKTLIDTAASSGISVVISAGNDDFTDGISEPACIGSAISVGGTDSSNAIHFNRGLILDVLAPGISITATNYSGTHVTYSGTSMSAPHVSGTIALIRQYSRLKYNRTLTPDEAKHALRYNGKWIYDSGSKIEFPRIDAYSAVNAKGIIPTTEGANPFYSLTSNPHNASCLSQLNEDEICNITWSINATGSVNSTYEFFAVLEMEYRQNISQRINLTIAYLYGVDLNNPADLSYSNSNAVEVNCTAIDSGGLSNVTLYGNFNGTWLANSTMNVSGEINFSSWTLNLADGDYLWNCRACSILNECITASENYTFTIDTTFPVFESINLSSTIELGYEQQFTANITEANINYVNISYSGLNETLLFSDGIYSLNFTPRQNGTVNYSVYAVDFAGNINVTSGSFEVNDSTDEPYIRLANFTGTVHQNAIQRFTAYAYDKMPLTVLLSHNGTNVTMQGSIYNFTYAYNETGCGNAAYTISANNSNFSSVSVGTYAVDLCCGNAVCESGESCSNCAADCGACTVSSSSGGGGSSSSSGAAASSKPSNEISISIPTASPDNPIETEIAKPMGIDSIRIEVNNEVKNARLFVSPINPAPGMSKPAERVYKYINISTTMGKDVIKSVSIGFSVNSSWLKANSIMKQDVRLFRNNKGWEELGTEFLIETQGIAYFSAKSSGFSIFAIGAAESKTETYQSEELPEISAMAAADAIPAAEGKDGLLAFWLSGLTIFYIAGISYIIISKRRARKIK